MPEDQQGNSKIASPQAAESNPLENLTLDNQLLTQLIKDIAPDLTHEFIQTIESTFKFEANISNEYNLKLLQANIDKEKAEHKLAATGQIMAFVLSIVLTGAVCMYVYTDADNPSVVIVCATIVTLTSIFMHRSKTKK